MAYTLYSQGLAEDLTFLIQQEMLDGEKKGGTKREWKMEWKLCIVIDSSVPKPPPIYCDG